VALPTTTFRFRPEILDLMDAWVERRNAKYGTKSSRVDLIEHMLRNAQIPDDGTPEAAAIYEAWNVAFGPEPVVTP
jgi:hypothetical protein